MSSAKLKAEVREILGSKVKQLRSAGIIPANIFGNTTDSVSVQVVSEDFRNVFAETGETGLIQINIEGEDRPVLIDNIQTHPVTDEILHIDFKQVNLKEKVVATVPLVYVGDSPAEKVGLVVMQQLNDVEVEALPMDLPEKIEVDLTTLVDTESFISIADLDTGNKFEIQAEKSQIVANVAEPREEEVEIVETEEEAEEGSEEKVEGETTEETPIEKEAE